MSDLLAAMADSCPRDRPAAESRSTIPDAEYRAYAQEQIGRITEVLTRVMFGDFAQVVRTSRADDAFGYLCTMINVAINAARNARNEQAAVSEELRRSNAELHVLIEQERLAGEAARRREARLRREGEALVLLSRRRPWEEVELCAAARPILESSADVLGVARASVWLLTPDRGALRSVDLWERDPAPGRHTSGHELSAAQFPAYFQALETERSLAAHDAAADPRTGELGASYLRPLGIGAMLDAPIRKRGGIEGVVCHEHVGPARSWFADEESFAASIADLLALALEASERRRAEDALRKSEEQFRQAQKMEAVGRLASGVAHDFNNLLTAILGFGDMALARLSRDDPARGLIGEVCRAGERAVGLTRQLLVFSRKQPTRPQPLDLNAVVGGILPMLRRLIGENVALRTELAPDLRTVLADPGRIEQVVVNLVVNARDAMPGGGEIVIATAGAAAEAASGLGSGGGDAGAREDLPPGAFVQLAVSDAGTGMTREVKARLFEPFFTTKPPGQGTGLGLSTVHGIVRQCGGAIRVESELGRGTTFRVLLPESKEPSPAVAPARERGAPVARGSEPILLVEDDDGVRSFARAVLSEHGYAVLEARSGTDALAIAAAHPGPIPLAIADAVMPDLGGAVLVERLRLARPGLRALSVSGYLDDPRRAASDGGGGGETAGTAFLAKPFSAEALLRAVRELLDAPSGAPV